MPPTYKPLIINFCTKRVSLIHYNEAQNVFQVSKPKMELFSHFWLQEDLLGEAETTREPDELV